MVSRAWEPGSQPQGTITQISLNNSPATKQAIRNGAAAGGRVGGCGWREMGRVIHREKERGTEIGTCTGTDGIPMKYRETERAREPERD